MKKMIAVFLFAINVASAEQLPFYVFKDKPSSQNHFIPSGWMGDYGDLKIAENEPGKEGTAEKFTYDAKARQGANWIGVYWQYPANNWGSRKSPYNLNGYKKITFWAKGAKGGEVINEFKMGGITGDYSDSDNAGIGPVTLTKEWKQYEIDLTGKELSMVIGGFCFSTSKDVNPEGFTIWIDEIRYE